MKDLKQTNKQKKKPLKNKKMTVQYIFLVQYTFKKILGFVPLHTPLWTPSTQHLLFANTY